MTTSIKMQELCWTKLGLLLSLFVVSANLLAQTPIPPQGLDHGTENEPPLTITATESDHCEVPGRWADRSTDFFDGSVYIIHRDLTGSRHWPNSCDEDITISITSPTTFYLHSTPDGVPGCAHFPYHANITFATCDTATGIFEQEPSNGQGTENWTRRGPAVTIANAAAYIETTARVQGAVLPQTPGTLQTSSDLTMTVRDQGVLVPGQTFDIDSEHPTGQDSFKQPGPTNFLGQTSATVKTRSQTGISIVRSSTEAVSTSSSAHVTWLPAHYESTFHLTCYVVSLESDFDSDPIRDTDLPGLPPPNSFPHSFVVDTRLQGTGYTDDGRYLHYLGSGTYRWDRCPRGSSGVCVTDHLSMAVDPTVIPLRSTLNVEGDGGRVAQDTGGNINGYHVDLFYGVRRHDCEVVGTSSYKSIDFLHY